MLEALKLPWLFFSFWKTWLFIFFCKMPHKHIVTIVLMCKCSEFLVSSCCYFLLPFTIPQWSTLPWLGFFAEFEREDPGLLLHFEISSIKYKTYRGLTDIIVSLKPFYEIVDVTDITDLQHSSAQKPDLWKANSVVRMSLNASSNSPLECSFVASQNEISLCQAFSFISQTFFFHF